MMPDPETSEFSATVAAVDLRAAAVLAGLTVKIKAMLSPARLSGELKAAGIRLDQRIRIARCVERAAARRGDA
jgi:hypothetical protein